jgi:hypothetical protein
MADRVPSFFLLVPGPWRDAGAVADGLRKRGVPGVISVDVVADEALAAGFRWGPEGATPAAVVDAVGACDHAAVIEVAGPLDERAREVAALGRALRELGGVAVRMEASGLASAWEPWLERIGSGAVPGIYRASVVVVGGDRSMFTCGMHQFDLPDAQIDDTDPADAVAWLGALNLFQLVDQPVLASGHTFRPDANHPRRVIERWPDHRHPDGDGRYNPFGLWRLVAADAGALRAIDPIPTIVPSLVAMLLAAERDKGAALTEAEVDRLVDEAAAIAMSAKDVRALERSRGYADIEPRRAWAQWQLVRSTLR